MVTSNTLEQCQYKMEMLEDRIRNNETHLYNLSDKYEKYYDKFEEWKARAADPSDHHVTDIHPMYVHNMVRVPSLCAQLSC